jgi:thiol-disulfide isomerase/thioredoxin
MNRTLKITLAMMVCAGLAGLARAQQPPALLKVGDAAPALAGGKWVKGDAVDKFEPGKIYVVEFWATWCGPCIAVIPHVSELQAKYEKDGLIVIGQNVWERDQSKVEPFVANMGEKMKYRVRMDDVSGGGDGAMAKTWMEAAGQGGIPCSFLIGKDGKIAWIGHPAALEPVLKQVIAGTFDPAKEAAMKDAQERAAQRLAQAMENKDYDTALKVVDEFEQSQPALAPQLAGLRFNIYLHKKDYDNAYKAAAKFGEAMNDNPGALNEVAWTIVDAEGLEKRDLDLAEKLATRAVELTERKNAPILDTLARVYFEKGQVEKAIAVQTEAVNNAGDDDTKKELNETLEKYKSAKKTT